MTPILFLTTLLFIATIVHLDIFSKALAGILPFYLIPQPEKSKYSKCHPANNRMRIFLSLLFFLTPLLIFILCQPQSIMVNETISQAILIFLIIATIILLYINQSYIWSDDFRTVGNPMINLKNSLKINRNKLRSSEKGMNRLIEELNNKIHHTETVTNEIENKVIINSNNIQRRSILFDYKVLQNREYIDSLRDKTINSNHLFIKTNNDINLKVTNTIELVKNIEKNLSTIRNTEKIKLKNKVELENKSFKDYFRNQATFEKFNSFILSNGFYNEDNKIAATPVCILLYKLETLEVIIRNKKDKYYCQSSAKFFNLDNIDPGMYSKIKSTIQTSTTAENQNKIDFDALSYLDRLI